MMVQTIQAVHCIVPARMGSSRYPGKPLIKIAGKEMILRTLEQALKANCFERIICATDDERIAQVVAKGGFEYVMTGPCNTGSDRVAEAAQKLGLDLVVNLQGDEPLVEPKLLKKVCQTLVEHPQEWVTVACPLNPKESSLKTVVKIKVKNDYAVDFRRVILESCVSEWFQHQGIYAYSKKCREEFASLPQSTLELANSLEQMRIINIRPIRVVFSPYASVSVDVPSDVKRVESLINSVASTLPKQRATLYERS